MARRLNGWQRLWVAVSAIWLLTVGAFSVSLMPKASDYASSRLYETLDVVGRHLEREDQSFRYEGAWATRTKYEGLNDDQLLVRLHEKFRGKVDFQSIEAEYRRKVDRLPVERARVVGIAFLVWFVPAAALYAFGLALAWIISGFRQPNA